MKMEGDKNSGVMDKPKAFNQPDKKEHMLGFLNT